MKITGLLVAVFISGLFFSGCTLKKEYTDEGKVKNSRPVVLENDYFKYVISGDGTNLSFIDK